MVIKFPLLIFALFFPGSSLAEVFEQELYSTVWRVFSHPNSLNSVTNEASTLNYSVSELGWVSMVAKDLVVRDLTHIDAISLKVVVHAPSNATLRVTFSDLDSQTRQQEMHWLDFKALLSESGGKRMTMPMSELKLSYGTGARHNDQIWDPANLASLELNFVGTGKTARGSVSIETISFHERDESN
ncbi:MAG: hypothetical protein ABJQ34_14360 [Paracoccaceae bacterium]